MDKAEEKPKQAEIPKSEPITPPPLGIVEKPTTGEQFQQKMVREVVVGLVIVLFIGFASMFVAVAAFFVNAWNSKQSSYEELTAKIIQQDGKIDQLSHVVCEMSKARGIPCSQ